MDQRLIGIMNLAFHPGTCEGEAVAAFLAARRLAGARGLDAIAAAPVVKEVVRARSREKVIECTQTIPASWQHDYLKNILQAVRRLDLDLDMHELGTFNDRVHGAMKLRFTVAGSRGNIVEFESMVKDLIEYIRQRI